MDDRANNNGYNKQQMTSMTSRQLTLPTSRPPALQRQASINPVTPCLIDTTMSVNNISSGYSSDVTISHTASDAHLVVTDAAATAATATSTTNTTTSTVVVTSQTTTTEAEEEEVSTNLYQVMYDYQASHDDELTLCRGNTIKLISRQTGDEGWWNGFNLSEGKKGIFPSNYVEPIVLNYKRELPPQIPYESLEFKECIGSGGFGKVFKGFWTRQESEGGHIEMVAIKKARIEGDKEDLISAVKESVLQEATLFWALRHPNIIQLMGVCFQEPNNFCLIMEYAKGGSLGRLLSVRKNGFPPYILIKWALQVSQCMFYLHEQASPYRIPIIHRDLKSSNILLSEDALSGEHRLADIQLKLTDFGLARELNKTAKDLSTAGTYSHMPPEVIKSSNYTKASDVWSFGVLLWELLTGEIPYKGIDPLTVAYGVAVNKLTLPIPSSCPQVFSDLIKACWHPDPHKRITFEQINQCLVDISNSPFALTPSESFWTMQQDWKSEIEEMFMQIKIREEELRSREEELERVFMRQQAYESMLRQREKALEEREKDLVIRELSMALQQKTTPYHVYQQQQQQQGLQPYPVQPTPEPKKRKKSGRLLTNFLRSSSNSHGSNSSNLNVVNPNNNSSSNMTPNLGATASSATMKSLEISSPSDFQHCMSIQHAAIIDNSSGGGGGGFFLNQLDSHKLSNPGTPDHELPPPLSQSPLSLIPPNTLPVLPTTMHHHGSTSNGGGGGSGGSGYNSCHAGNTPTATATHFVFSPNNPTTTTTTNSTTNSSNTATNTNSSSTQHQGSVSPNMRLRITLQPSLDRGMGPSNSFIVYPSSPAQQQQLAYMMINNNASNSNTQMMMTPPTHHHNHSTAAATHNTTHHLSPNTPRSSRLQMKSISIDHSYNYPAYPVVVNPSFPGGGSLTEAHSTSSNNFAENGANFNHNQHASRSKTTSSSAHPHNKQTISPNNGVHHNGQHIGNVEYTNGIMEFVSVSHSPSMRSISADVGHHHHQHHQQHQYYNQYQQQGYYTNSHQNYHLLNKSQDLVSIHSTNSTSLVSGLNGSNLIIQNSSSSNATSNNNISSNVVQSGGGKSSHNINNRKLSRILYEIGSILSFVGLGKDYKHQQQQQQQQVNAPPQTPSSLHSNTLLLSSQPSMPKPSSSKHHARRSQEQKKQTVNSGLQTAEHSSSHSNSVSGFIKSHAKSMLSSNPLKEQQQHQQQYLTGYAANAHELVGGGSTLHHLQSNHQQNPQSPSHSLTRLSAGGNVSQNQSVNNNQTSSSATAVVKSSRFKSLSSTSGSHMTAASHYHKSFEERVDDVASTSAAVKRLSPSTAARNAASALVAQSAAAQAASTSSLLSVDMMPVVTTTTTTTPTTSNNRQQYQRDNNLLSPRATTTIVRQESLNPPRYTANGAATASPNNGLYVNNNTQIMRSMQKKYSKSIDCTPHHLNLNNGGGALTTTTAAQMYLDPHHHLHHHQHHQSVLNQSNHTMSSSNSGISYSGSGYLNNGSSNQFNQQYNQQQPTSAHQNTNNQSSMSSISSSISQSNSVYGGNNNNNVTSNNNNNSNYYYTGGEVVSSTNSTMTNSPLVPRRADYEPVVRVTTIQRQNRIYEQPSPTIGGVMGDDDDDDDENDENFGYSTNCTNNTSQNGGYSNSVTTQSSSSSSNKTSTTSQVAAVSLSSPNLPNRPITLDLKQPFNDSSNDIIELMGSGQIVSINKTKSPSPTTTTTSTTTIDSVIQTSESQNNNKNQISPPSNLIQMNNNTMSGKVSGGGSSSSRQQLQMNMRDTSPFSSLSSSSAAASSVPSSLSPMGTSPRLLHKPISSSSNHSNSSQNTNSAPLPPPLPPLPPLLPQLPPPSNTHHHNQSQC